MIIPVRCFTCGKVIGDKYRWYLEQVAELKAKPGKTEKTEYFHLDFTGETAEAIVMNRLNLTRQCCRRHMLTHVDIE